MLILADTCSVLMLLRIAPDMFTDPEYECITTTEVLKELKSNQKFKTKYPWLKELIPNVCCIENSKLKTNIYDSTLSTINILLSTNPINTNTDRVFDLSRVDRHIIASAATHGHSITTGEKDIIDFAEQQFDVRSLSALGVLNGWIENGLIECNDYLLAIFDDWEKSREAGQPKEDIGQFQKLTKRFYLGPDQKRKKPGKKRERKKPKKKK